MTQDRWRRIDQILTEALEEPPDNRVAYILDACGTDEALADEVRSLLGLMDEAESYLGDNVAGFAAPVLQPLLQYPPDDSPGRSIGRYQIIREIGRGGMGSVYLARRADGAFDKEVALKLVRRPRESGAAQMFESEAQILARLDHPNIARLFDADVLDGGWSFLVMEYVRGEAIDTYCQERGLSLNERLELFCVVCEAVQYAHRNLVVHRDIKPAHALVTEDGVVKLVDFGIARLLNPDIPETDRLTRTDQRQLTPGFASPEQLRGELLTTATDIYSLGVLLFVLLTGRPPFDIAGLSASERDRTVTQTPPPRPSDVLERQRADGRTPHESADRLERVGLNAGRLRGDLDTIVLKALAKEPDQRYHSATALADDIRRYLSGKPIVARPPDVRYRLSRFVKRNRLAVAGSLAIAITLVLGVLGMAWQATEAAEQAQRAAQERDKAEQTSGFLVQLFSGANPLESRGEAVTAGELLTRGMERIEALQAQPEVQAGLLHTIGTVYQNLGSYENALAALSRALEIRETNLPPNSPEIDDTRFVLATVLQILGRHEEALAHFDLLVAGLRTATASGASVSTSRLLHVGHVYNARRDYEAAEELYRQALFIQARDVGTESVEAAVTMRYLGDTVHRLGRYAEAESVFESARGVFESLDSAHPELGPVLSGLAEVAFRRGDLTAAEPLLRESIRIDERVHGPSFAPAAVKRQRLSALLREQRRLAEATTELQLARERIEGTFGPSHVLTAAVDVERAALLEASRDFNEALLVVNSAVAILEARLAPDHERLGFAYLRRGSILVALGAHDEAERSLLKSLAIFAPRSAANPFYAPQTSESASQLIRLYEAWGRPEAGNFYRSYFTQS